MKPPVLKLNYNFPRAELLQVFRTRFPEMEEWIPNEDFRSLWLKDFESKTIKGFLVDTGSETLFVKQFADTFCKYYQIKDPNYTTQFLYLHPSAVLPWHEDRAPTKASVNFILEETKEPIEFECGTYHYTVALVNILKKHRIINGIHGRPIFRILFHGPNSYYETLFDSIQIVENQKLSAY